MALVKTIPLSEDDLNRYIFSETPEILHLDYSNSRFKGKSFLNYIYNGSINPVIENISNEELKELIGIYLSLDKLLSIKQLNDICVIDIVRYIDNKPLLYLSDKDAFSLILLLSSSLILSYNRLIDDHYSCQKKSDELVHKNFISLIHSEYFIILTEKILSMDIDIVQFDCFNDISFDGYDIYGYYYANFFPLSILKLYMEDESPCL